jgi:transcriptional regulator with XRE-family HTH domain
MTALRKRRERSGLTQYVVSRRAGVSRMRLSLAECGQLHLRPEEEAAVRRVIREGIEKHATQLQRVLASAESAAV